MKKSIILTVGLALVLGACGRGKDEAAPAPKPTPVATAIPQVKFDPSFVDIAGSWISKPDALGEKRLLRVDIASGGGYSIDVRLPGTPEQVVETGRGTASANGDVITASPGDDTKGTVLKGLGAWKANVMKSEKTMVLTGADGRSVPLAWKGL